MFLKRVECVHTNSKTIREQEEKNTNMTQLGESEKERGRGGGCKKVVKRIIITMKKTN